MEMFENCFVDLSNDDQQLEYGQLDAIYRDQSFKTEEPIQTLEQEMNGSVDSFTQETYTQQVGFSQDPIQEPYVEIEEETEEFFQEPETCQEAPDPQEINEAQEETYDVEYLPYDLYFPVPTAGSSNTSEQNAFLETIQESSTKAVRDCYNNITNAEKEKEEEETNKTSTKTIIIRRDKRGAKRKERDGVVYEYVYKNDSQGQSLPMATTNTTIVVTRHDNRGRKRKEREGVEYKYVYTNQGPKKTGDKNPRPKKTTRPCRTVEPNVYPGSVFMSFKQRDWSNIKICDARKEYEKPTTIIDKIVEEPAVSSADDLQAVLDGLFPNNPDHSMNTANNDNDANNANDANDDWFTNGEKIDPSQFGFYAPPSPIFAPSLHLEMTAAGA